MEHFTHLVILHFHHDCTDYLLNVIAQNNSQTLRILDFSFSQSVTDSSVQSIVKCGFLQEIDLLGKEWITDLGSLIGNFNCRYATVWKFSNFPAIKILREINFG